MAVRYGRCANGSWSRQYPGSKCRRLFIDRLLWLRPRVNSAGQEFNAILMELAFDGLAEVGARPFRNPELDICCAFD
jgi:hypothetical protein